MAARWVYAPHAV